MANSFSKTPIQLKEVKPKMTGNTKAEKVTLDLEKGDTPQAGAPTAGNEIMDGIEAVTALGQAKPASLFGFVRFHVLNADNGGRPVGGNLTAASRDANHNGKWETFEQEENELIPKSPAVEKTNFEATVSYYDSKEVSFKGRGKK